MNKSIIIAIVFLAFTFNACTKLDPSEAGNLVPKTVEEDANIPSITLSKTKLYIQKFGKADSTKIFILEGGPGNDFRYLLDLNKQIGSWSLLQNHQVIYHDYRGSGLSKRHPTSELTLDLLLKDFEELVDKISPNNKIIIIGHSHGGLLAAQYVNANPNRVKGVVFIEPAAFSREINDRTINVYSPNYFGQDVNKILWFRQLVAANDHTQADYQFAVSASNYSDPLRGENCGFAFDRMGMACNITIGRDELTKGQYDFTTNLGKYNNKVLFISSDQSKDIGYDFQQKNQVVLFPKATHKKVEGTGHAGLINCRTDETLGLIKDYLQSL